jgi:phosphatidylglycerophosphatase A
MFAQPSWSRHIAPQDTVRLATIGPLGTGKRAPGTWGSAAGLLYFLVCFSQFGVREGLVVTAVTSALAAYFAVGVCGDAERLLGRHDPSEVILDEFVAMPLCFLGWQWIALPGFLGLLVMLASGFALFRFFDIRKPFFINSLQDLPGGWGIVADDTAAALATCLTMHIAHLAWALA